MDNLHWLCVMGMVVAQLHRQSTPQSHVNAQAGSLDRHVKRHPAAIAIVTVPIMVVCVCSIPHQTVTRACVAA